MTAPAPIFRSQGNRLFRTDVADKVVKRGQESPYDINGAPVSQEAGFLAIDINDMPSANPAEPLHEFVVPPGFTVVFNGSDAINAGVGATGTPSLPIQKNGAANGSIDFVGTAGTATFSDSTYAAGDLFSLYPPATADATLDRVRIVLGVD